MNNKQFFDYVKYSLGTKNKLDNLPILEELEFFYDMANRQSLLGLLIVGLEKLYKENVYDKNEALTQLIMRWYGYTRIIEKKNIAITKRCIELTQLFVEGGFRTCVLKGQGNATYYPKPLLRQSGDIDLWVEGERDDIVSFIRSRGVNVHDIHIVHADAEFFGDVHVEVHFQPSWMYNPFANLKLKKFIKEQEKIQFQLYDKQVGYAHPTNYFNLVYNLIHINRHIFDEGIGLRQIVDYYYILKASNEKERQLAMEQLHKLSLSKFTSALMYVMQQVLGMDNNLNLCTPSKKYGERLLTDIMEGGNFGKFGKYARTTTNNQRIKRAFDNLNRNWQFITTYPEEVLWIPYFKVWHYCWRKFKGYL